MLPTAGTGPAFPEPLLVLVSGPDQPGIAADLFDALDICHSRILDVEQVHILGQLLLAVVIAGPDAQRVTTAVLPVAKTWGVAIDVSATTPPAGTPPTSRQLVTVMAPELGARALRQLFEAIGSSAGNVERIVQLATTPVQSYELLVAGAQPDLLRRKVAAAAAGMGVDAAVQRAGLHRRARHLIVLDVDSTLIRGEVVDLLAERAGCAQAVAAITASAMAGALDFEAALRQRVALLRGLPASVLDDVRRSLQLTPGARTLVRTLQRLGYDTAVVSGGFLQVIEPMAAELGIGRVAANTLAVADGVLTGELIGPVIDRPGKAAAMRRFAAEAGVPLARTVAVGDGANDVDMLAQAGLGIAFNAKPVVRDVADTTVNVPYLDTILFLLGVPRSEIEAADTDSSDNDTGGASDSTSDSDSTTDKVDDRSRPDGQNRVGIAGSKPRSRS